MAVYDYFGKLMPTTAWSSRMVTGSKTYVEGATLTGSAGDDNFVPNAVRRMVGLAGNDTYQYVTMATEVVEAANGGTDTVYVNSSYLMPANVENLQVWWAPHVIGNSLGNLVIGSAGNQTFDGALGNDVIAGAGGVDMFIASAKSGYDVITDFTTSGAGADIVRLAGYVQFTSFAQVKAAMTQSGSDVVLTLDGGNAIKFSNHVIVDFQASNFYLGLDRSTLRATFSEQFDTLELWSGGSGVWRTDYGYGATSDSLQSRTLASNGEQQIYIDAAMRGAGTTAIGISPFAVQGGVLTITASPTPEALTPQLYGMDYVSGLLTTKQSFAQQYGYFEARMKLPAGDGMWPAFWLLPADGSWPPEIDVMENYGKAETSYTVHSAASGSHSFSSGFSFDPQGGDSFHSYGLSWTAETISWYLDGVKVHEVATPADLHRPMYMLVNLAVHPSAALGMTDRLQVDYVRAYANEDTVGRVLTGTSGADVFAVSTALDTIVDTTIGDGDVARSWVDYSLPGTVENLTLLGVAARGVGNALANVLIGSAGKNTLFGKDGADTLDGRAGADILYGDGGNDLYIVDNIGDRAVETGAALGIDTVRSGVSFTLGSHVEQLLLTGTAAIDGTGNDIANVLTGNGSANRLSGGAGADQLTGGLGTDTLTGGADGDRFYFDGAPGPANVDTITDFSSPDDALYLDRDVFTALGAAGPLVAGAFVSGITAADAADRILYDQLRGDLYYDPDGSGSAAALLVAHLQPGALLTPADIFVYA